MEGQFQPTLPRGERQFIIFAPKTFTHFNPRSREGSDLVVLSLPHFSSISTHAPARGATFQVQFSLSCHRFQPTLPRGERHIFQQSFWKLQEFQPTLPRGERPDISKYASMALVFQPTLPRGERRYYHTVSVTFQKFQPTLPRGERHTLIRIPFSSV